jgi:hypothetical protein
VNIDILTPFFDFDGREGELKHFNPQKNFDGGNLKNIIIKK